MIYKTKIISQKELAKNTNEISFKRPKNFSFKAGQYIQVALNELLYPDYKGNFRVFSIASSPLDKEKISIAFRNTESGFKKTLLSLPEKSYINFQGPYGFYTFPQNLKKTLVFMVGGIGITPCLSMIRFASERGFNFPIILFYFNKNQENIAYLQELQKIEANNKNFIFINKIGAPSEVFIRQHIEGFQNLIWYLSGPGLMIDYVKNILFSLGVDNFKIYCEEFSGY